VPKVRAISDSEWKVMKILWSQSLLPAYDITAAFAKTEKWHPNTVKTLLSRLHRKKAVAVKRYKNLYLYRPVVSEQQCVHAESESFLQRIFGGSVRRLLVHFITKQKLSREDLHELKKLLKERGLT
jgi:BlaI family penicillinase repressor